MYRVMEQKNAEKVFEELEHCMYCKGKKLINNYNNYYEPDEDELEKSFLKIMEIFSRQVEYEVVKASAILFSVGIIIGMLIMWVVK